MKDVGSWNSHFGERRWSPAAAAPTYQTARHGPPDAMRLATSRTPAKMRIPRTGSRFEPPEPQVRLMIRFTGMMEEQVLACSSVNTRPSSDAA